MVGHHVKCILCPINIVVQCLLNSEEIIELVVVYSKINNLIKLIYAKCLNIFPTSLFKT